MSLRSQKYQYTSKNIRFVKFNSIYKTLLHVYMYVQTMKFSQCGFYGKVNKTHVFNLHIFSCCWKGKFQKFIIKWCTSVLNNFRHVVEENGGRDNPYADPLDMKTFYTSVQKSTADALDSPHPESSSSTTTPQSLLNPQGPENISSNTDSSSPENESHSDSIQKPPNVYGFQLCFCFLNFLLFFMFGEGYYFAFSFYFEWNKLLFVYIIGNKDAVSFCNHNRFSAMMMHGCKDNVQQDQ